MLQADFEKFHNWVTDFFFQNLSVTYHNSRLIFYGVILSRAQKYSPWKVFWINYPQTPWLLSRRGHRCPEARLSQHYMDPKMTLCHFSNFCKNKFPGLTTELSCTYWMNLFWCFAKWFLKIATPKVIQKCAGVFLSSRETFFLQKFDKCQNVIFGPM